MTSKTDTADQALTLGDRVQADRVHTSLYTDPAIFEAEMDKIFSSTWVWVAHTSEIPEAGSFKNTYIGRQPVIVVRDRKQKGHVLLNRCRHRAATGLSVQWVEAGPRLLPGLPASLDADLRRLCRDE